MTVNNKVNGTSRKPVKLIGVAVLVIVAVVVVVWFQVVRAEEDPMATMATFVAKRGPLTISVLESGAIKAKEQEVIRNDVEGRTTIISIVPEGAHVQEGDLLVELDVSTLKDSRIDQEIRVQNALASWINATETLDITKSQAQSDIDKAELTLKFADQDLKVYLEGQYLNDKTVAENRVTEANEVLTRAVETLKWSETLFKEKYISETEVLADRLSKNKSENSVGVARNELRLLEEFTKQRKIDQYTSDVSQAQMALDRTKAKARANIVQAEADLKAKEQELSRQRDKLKKIDEQIAKAVINSPADGMVVYATSSRGGFGRDDRRPLADGVEVFQRQELIYIPKSSSSVAEVDVHEASLDKVRPGLPAVVTIDALPGKKFIGTVDRIAPLPNAQSMWMNPDLKVYTTNINLETNDPGLRSGMSCKAEIIVAQYQDVVYVPVQAVLRVGGQPTVFLVQNGQVQERKVEIGMDNNSMIVIRKGLDAGEVVLLTPPLRAATMEPGERVGDANDTTAQRINEKLKAADEMEAGRPTMPRRQATQSLTGTQGQPAGPGVGGVGQGGQGFQMPTAEQVEEARKRFESMSPEERQQEMQRIRQQMENSMTPEQREQMRQRFQDMTPEQREQMRQRRGGGGQGEGGGPGFGGRGDGSGRGQGGRRGDADTGSGQPQGGQ